MSLFSDSLPTLPWKEAVRLVRKVAPKRSTLPILQYAKATCDGEYCILLATDLGIGISIRTPCAEKPGEYLLDVALLAAGIPFAACVSTIPAEEFPAIPEVGESPEWLPAHWVPDMCNVAFACSVDQTRLSLNGVAIQPQGVTAVDGHRLSHRAGGTGIKGEAIVPSSTVALVAGIKHAVDRIALTPSVLRPIATFLYPWGHVVSKLCEGPFPNWRQTVPRAHSWEATFPRVTWTEWLKQCPDLKSPDPKKPMTARIQMDRVAGKLRVSYYHGTVGELELATMDNPGGNFSIAWNPKYLVESIAHVEGGTVTLAGNTETQATLLQPGSGNIDIVMPLKRV